MKIKLKLGSKFSLMDYLKEYKGKQKEFLTKLAELGVSVADIRFKAAIYDGVNDVVVNEPRFEGNKIIIDAVGSAVTFIEFGSGITYNTGNDKHPLADELGMKRGAYGKGKGKQKAWAYYGDDPGTNGRLLKLTPKGPLILTKGNPANRAMYEAAKVMRENILKIAKEVFR